MKITITNSDGTTQTIPNVTNLREELWYKPHISLSFTDSNRDYHTKSIYFGTFTGVNIVFGE